MDTTTMTAIELTDQELGMVTGAWRHGRYCGGWGGCGWGGCGWGGCGWGGWGWC